MADDSITTVSSLPFLYERCTQRDLVSGNSYTGYNVTRPPWPGPGYVWRHTGTDRIPGQRTFAWELQTDEDKLYCAMLDEDIDEMKKLVSAGRIDLTKPLLRGKTALSIALKEVVLFGKKIEMVSYLLDQPGVFKQATVEDLNKLSTIEALRRGLLTLHGLGPWRPRKAQEYPSRVRAVMRTLLLLAKMNAQHGSCSQDAQS